MCVGERVCQLSLEFSVCVCVELVCVNNFAYAGVRVCVCVSA